MRVFENLLYLDRDFISALYESEKGYSAETKITRTEGINAGMHIPLFSAGASSIESKAYSISTLQMLSELEESLESYPQYSDSDYEFGKSSKFFWVIGSLTIEEVTVKHRNFTVPIIGEPTESNNNQNEQVIAKESYFSIHSGENTFALLSTQDYFVSGIASFAESTKTVVEKIDMPIKALIRVYSAQTSFKQWIAVPMVITEHNC